MSNATCSALQRDPWYRTLYEKTGSIDLITRAGFFDDKLPDERAPQTYYALDLLTTPVVPFKEITTSEPIYVLISTGAFSPIHHGHIAMMTAAKTALEQEGKIVLGGYLSPSHDSYVSKKYGGAAALPAVERVELCRQALIDHPWLLVDPWEALYTPCALNFTTVIDRLGQYLKKRWPGISDLRLVYVCGSDNADFAYAFRYSGGDFICVERTNFSALTTKKALAAYRKRLRFLPPTPTSHCSSRRVRNGNYDDIPSNILPRYQKTRQQKNPTPPRSLYLIRSEGAWAVQPWTTKKTKQTLITSYQKFVQSIGKDIATAFNQATASDSTHHITPYFLHLDEQKNISSRLTRPTISLDPCIPGTYQFSISRIFTLSDGQHVSRGLTARPGAAPLSKQSAIIPPGAYTLLEDDIGSGFTVKAMLNELAKDINLNAWTILSKLRPNRNEPMLDIVDGRDFLAGARQGGLVVALPDGTLARAPYTWPYVSLHNRASIPLSQEYWLSQQIWKLNLKWYSHVTPHLRLHNADPTFQTLMRYIGFSLSDTMSAICFWHLAALTRLTSFVCQTALPSNQPQLISNLPTSMLTRNSAKNKLKQLKNLRITYEHMNIQNPSLPLF